jgi:hypothetical protein
MPEVAGPRAGVAPVKAGAEMSLFYPWYHRINVVPPPMAATQQLMRSRRI